MRLVYEALGYAARGFAVFPCSPNSKQPLVKSDVPGEGGVKLATRDPDTIRRWWKEWPDAMIGAATGAPASAFVIDLDPPKGKTAADLLKAVTRRAAELKAEMEAALKAGESVADFAERVERDLDYALPSCPIVETPRGGLHLWFAMPADIDIGNRAGVIPGVDVRGTGGYVILPPSTRRGPKARDEGCEGVAYAFRDGAGFDDLAPPASPPEIIRFVTERQGRDETAAAAREPPGGPLAVPDASVQGTGASPRDRAIRRYTLSAFDEEVQRATRAGKGGRNAALNSAALKLGHLVEAGLLSEPAVVAALEGAAAANGLLKEDGPRSVAATIKSGLRRGRAEPTDVSAIGTRAGLSSGRPPPPDDDDRIFFDHSRAADPQPSDRRATPEAHRRGSGSGGASLSKGGGGGGAGEPPPADSAEDPEEERLRATLAYCANQPQNDTGNGRRLMAWFGDDFLNVDIGEGMHVALGLHHFVGTHWDMDGGQHAVQRFAQIVAERINDEADYLAFMPWEEAAIRAAKLAMEKEEDELTEEDEEAIRAGKAARAQLGKRKVGRRKFALSCGNSARLSGMIAQALPHKTVPVETLDRDALAINVKNGTLRAVAEHDPECPDADCDGIRCGRRVWTMRLDPHRRGDLISKVMAVAYDPAATAPKWSAFIERFQPNPAIRRYLQAFHGLGLTALTEQIFVLNYGLGANGKSTFMEALGRLQGDYAKALPAEALTGQMQRRGDQATPEFARLPGARLVRCAELPRGESFRENTIKMLTGGEAIPVRHLHGRFFEFIPVFKAVGSCNEKPDIGGVSHGTWRRVKLIPWDVTIATAEQRKIQDVLADFEGEAAGILNWLLAGLVDYLTHGLVEPEEIRAATESYRDDMDPVGAFVDACVVVDDGHDEGARDVYLAYVAWSHANAMRPYSAKAFGMILPQKGIVKERGRLVKYKNIRLHDVPTDPDRHGGHERPPPPSEDALAGAFR